MPLHVQIYAPTQWPRYRIVPSPQRDFVGPFLSENNVMVSAGRRKEHHHHCPHHHHKCIELRSVVLLLLEWLYYLSPSNNGFHLKRSQGQELSREVAIRVMSSNIRRHSTGFQYNRTKSSRHWDGWWRHYRKGQNALLSPIWPRSPLRPFGSHGHPLLCTDSRTRTALAAQLGRVVADSVEWKVGLSF